MTITLISSDDFSNFNDLDDQISYIRNEAINCFNCNDDTGGDLLLRIAEVLRNSDIIINDAIKLANMVISTNGGNDEN